MRIVLSLLTVVACLARLEEKSVINIAGWGQSGTSFMLDLFHFTPNTATAIDTCAKFKGITRCISFNFENQWIIPRNMATMMSSGNYCVLSNSSLTDAEKQKYLYEVEEFIWNATAEDLYVIDKSPALILKIPLLADIYKNYKSQKYVLMLKHPATLNTLLPTHLGWSEAISVLKGGNATIKGNLRTSSEIESHMLKYLLYRWKGDFFDETSTDILVRHRCNRNLYLSWLLTMETLAHQLQMHDEFTRKNVALVRFEDFASRPLDSCNRLLSFVFSEDDTWTSERVSEHCKSLFNDHATRSSAEVRRSLRLHFKKNTKADSYPTSFSFDLTKARHSCSPRMKSFSEALPLLSAETRDAILSANERLKQMGYSFQEPFYLYETNESVFDRWDVMKRKDI